MIFVGYIIDFLISYFLQKFLRISNFKEKFSRFYFRCSLLCLTNAATPIGKSGHG